MSTINWMFNVDSARKELTRAMKRLINHNLCVRVLAITSLDLRQNVEDR